MPDRKDHGEEDHGETSESEVNSDDSSEDEAEYRRKRKLEKLTKSIEKLKAEGRQSRKRRSAHKKKRSSPRKEGRKRKDRSSSKTREQKRQKVSEGNEDSSTVAELMKKVAEMAEQIKVFQSEKGNVEPDFDKSKAIQSDIETEIDNSVHSPEGLQNIVSDIALEKTPVVMNNQESIINGLRGIKSPSDTTMYAPAVKLDNNLMDEDDKDPDMDAINQYISQIRLGVSSLQSDDGHAARSEATRKNSTKDNQMKKSYNVAEEAIIAAEKFKASIQPPPKGNTFDDNFKLKLARYFDNEDDKFFHITCHVDPVIRAKIHKGEFIELEKLLQKPEALMYKKRNRYQMIIEDGQQVWTEAEDKSTKIEGIRRWEQAFRIYAAIFCEANPNRSVEILQYIETINDASKKFTWESVAHYDFVVRHLQASRPHRNWGKTYMQMYMRIRSQEQHQQFRNTFERSHNTNQLSLNGSNTKTTCWRFNKGNCSYGRECRFEHKCSYCGSTNHGYYNCRRRSGGRRNSGNGSSDHNRSSSSSEGHSGKKKKNKQAEDK